MVLIQEGAHEHLPAISGREVELCAPVWPGLPTDQLVPQPGLWSGWTCTGSRWFC